MEQNNLGKTITKLIEDSGMNDKEFQERYGCSRQYVFQLKLEGCKSVNSLAKVATILGMKQSEILALAGL